MKSSTALRLFVPLFIMLISASITAAAIYSAAIVIEDAKTNAVTLCDCDPFADCALDES